MILADTSVWIAHLRAGEPRLRALLEEGQVLLHPFVLGELACGNLRKRAEVLAHLRRLDAVPPVSDEEAHRLLEHHHLAGKGLGWVDVHLLASCLVAGAKLWTFDRRLAETAEELGLAGER